MSQDPGRDPAFMEVINKHMHVPEHLSVGPRQQRSVEEGDEAMKWPEEPPPAYSMHVPDRLTYTEAPDMSPRPLFSPPRPILCSPLSLEPCWESPSGEVFYRDTLQEESGELSPSDQFVWDYGIKISTVINKQKSPIRRSYSDQSFGRTPPGTPTQLKQALAVPRHPSTSRSPGRHVRQSSKAPLTTQTTVPQTQAEPFPANPLDCLSPHSMLQAARQLGLQTSQRLLQMVSQKYRFNNQATPPPARVTPEVPASARVENNDKRAMESWSQEEEGGAVVEFIILRRQVMKMSRRLAVLERHNAERRNTEVILFSLLFSACLLNAWLWIRR